MTKIVKYGSEVNQKFLNGMSKMAEIVGSTMGARGRTVALNEYGSIHLTKDGITVAKAFDLKDPIENMGAKLVREASDKTNSECGDGSTGVCVLLESIYKNGLKHTSIGANPVLVKNGISKAAENVTSFINTISTPISMSDEIKNVALVSSNGDKEIADVISEVFSKIGKNGTIRVEDGQTMKMESKIVEGCAIDAGYASPYFITNEKQECNMTDAVVMVTDKKLANINDLLPVLQAIAPDPQRGFPGKQLLIICDSIEGDCLSTLVLNRLRGGMTICAVKAPGYGEVREATLNDICALTGAKLVSDNTGISLAEAVTALGQCKSVISTKTTTTFIGGVHDDEEFNKYIENLKNQIENEKNEYLKKKFTERLGRLTDGVGVISCGAATEAELKEKKDRVDDAFNSVKNATKLGVVPGGGVALLKAMKNLEVTLMKEDMPTDEMIGVKILHDSLVAPITKIVENAGECPELVIENILAEYSVNANNGYDVSTKEYCNMLERGIIDPTTVIISEVNNAASIAGTLLTTDSCIIEVPDENDNKNQVNQMPMM